MDFDVGEQSAEKIWMGKLLHSMGIAKVQANLSGSGDSGDLDDVCYSDADGKDLVTIDIDNVLEKMTIDDGSDQSRTFLDVLRDTIIITDATDMGNWYDSEGGNVWISYAVTAEGMGIEDSTFDYNEDDPDEDEYDDEGPDEDDEPDDDDFEDDPEP